MPINFDDIIDRKNTNSLKYDFAAERGKPEGILPMLVADMDFRVYQPILDDLHDAINHGIFGYSEAKNNYFIPLHNWFYTHFQWETKSEWLIKTPGVVYAIAAAIHAFTKEGEAILIQQPVYYPFMECIMDSDRTLVNNQLVYQNGKYTIDFEDFENKIINNNVKLFLLCSPHNPVGRVWTKEELTKMGEICVEHNVIVLSDEIHCDFTYDGYTHTVFSSINDTFASHAVICTSPSKTFNMAGMQISNIFIPNPELRKSFKHAVDASGYSQLGTLGLIACQSAYEKGEPWYLELKDYLAGNLEFVRNFIQNKIPEIKLVEPEGTYLIWLDFSYLELSTCELENLIINKAKLWLDNGAIFGKETNQFERINIACPRATLNQALVQLEHAIHVK